MEPNNKKVQIHTLLGGLITEMKEHCQYQLDIESLKNKFSCKIKAVDQSTSCRKILRLKEKRYGLLIILFPDK